MPSLNRIVLIHLLALLLPAAAIAEPQVRIRHVYYHITGDNAAEIWDQIRQKSPVKHNGRLHVAYTRWDVSWRFWWLKKADSCEISRVTTVLDVAYTMPKLETEKKSSAKLVSQWEDFIEALFSHEQGHKELGLQAANEIEDRISSLAPSASCSELERAANTAAKDIIEEYSRIEEEYDRRTNHGIRTGAVFPQP